MLNKANITWSVKQVVKMIGNGKITFENSVQRGFVWNKSRQSLLIHSIITGYPIPPCFCRKGEDGIYDMLMNIYKQVMPTTYQVGADVVALDEVNQNLIEIQNKMNNL